MCVCVCVGERSNICGKITVGEFKGYTGVRAFLVAQW